MAKTSKIAAQQRREKLVEKYAEQRQALKETIRTASSFEEKQAAVRKLAELPRDSSRTRLRNRDSIDGRPRAYIRKVGLSRINFRAQALRGELPGFTKSSW
ncbi:30S ribosomal protein S14 [Timonella sp. A28]|uniref:30S ribosomal protein S14 n=1 Tax=Timonella sp. A28 TaxID=3442640 RepID=UPI003EBCAAED